MNILSRRHFAPLFIAGLLAMGSVSTAAAADINGFEVGNGQLFGVPAGHWLPALNGLYGRLSENTKTSPTLNVRTFKEVVYGAFRDLRRVLEPKGFESVRAEGGSASENLDAMEREGFGHGEGRCSFEMRFLNAKKELVTADYVAVPDCTLEQAMHALQDHLQSEQLIR